MESFEGKLAVITGAGTGMGRELAKQLAAAGCHLALGDVDSRNVEATAEVCREGGRVNVSTHLADVADQPAVIRFRDEVVEVHQTDHVNLLFNNAGIAAGGSFVSGDTDEWERTFAVCWSGVYHTTRAFMALLVAAEQARIVNTSSINGFWASLGPHTAHTAYSTAKFAVKGFSEALITDLRLNAPHVGVSVVMPGHIGTDILVNSARAFDRPDPSELPDEALGVVRADLESRGLGVASLSDEELRAMLVRRVADFRERAPTSAEEAARIILDGVRAERWRILVGEDAEVLDRMVRDDPQGAYEVAVVEALHAQGHLRGLMRREG